MQPVATHKLFDLGDNRLAVPIAVLLFAFVFIAIFLTCRFLECIFGECGHASRERPVRKERYGSRSLKARVGEVSRLDKKRLKSTKAE